ncbi:unnamed protein product [Parnassius apollo]|uniref:(apollo) hypothetical protein n=1 Tax=Parnassius apollo TaxID=110799 RepID=A0A8S3WQ37_PARAO|nr:unnamed protein product [Parnassius apollo]
MHGSRTILKLCLAILVFSESKSIDLKLSNDLYKYGPYDLVCRSYEVCIDAKVTNLISYSTKLLKEGNNYVAWLNCTFFAQTRIDEIKIKVYTTTDNRTRLLMNYELNNPCQHYAVASIIENYLNAKNCIIKQGPYDLVFSRYENCINPKVTNITSCSIKLMNEVNNYVAYVDCTFFALARIDEIKVKVYNVKDNRTRLLWSYKQNNPGQHYAVADLIKKIKR